MLSASDIRWTLAPVPAPDPLGLSDEDLLVAALSEAESYRALAQVASALLADLRRSYERLREQHHRLINEYRAYRAQHEAAP